MSEKIKYISGAAGAPGAIGPYSQAAEAGGMVFLSGQVPLDPESGELQQGIEAQTEQVMSNLKAVLEHCGLGFENVIKTSIFLTDLGNFKTINDIYEKWLGDAKPARATVQVSALPVGADVEIDMIAVRS